MSMRQSLPVGDGRCHLGDGAAGLGAPLCRSAALRNRGLVRLSLVTVGLGLMLRDVLS